ncbi:hypothetical protein ACQ1PL_05915 [Ornithobacterium rhinotracheale]
MSNIFLIKDINNQLNENEKIDWETVENISKISSLTIEGVHSFFNINSYNRKIIEDLISNINQLKKKLSNYSEKRIYEEILFPINCKINLHQNMIVDYRKSYNEAKQNVESGCMKLDEKSSEYIARENRFEECKKEYFERVEKIRKLYKQREEKINLCKLPELTNIIDKLELLKAELKLYVKNDNKTSIGIGIKSDYLHKSYRALVSECQLVEDVDYILFIETIDLISNFSLKKKPKKDKYISYYIHLMKKYIDDDLYQNWAEHMINGFEIKDHDKKNVKEESNKTKTHRKIDNIFEEKES